MQFLRNAQHLSRWVMVWFALTLGVATASPLVNPQTIQLVCSVGGSMQMVVLDGQGEAVTSLHASLECPLCLGLSLPPEYAYSAPTPATPADSVLRPVVSTHRPVQIGGPFPPRGPPQAV